MAAFRSRRGWIPLVAFLIIPMVTGLSPAAASAASAAPAVARAPALEQVQSVARIPNGARAVGTLVSTTSINGAVVLKPRDENAVEAFISEVTNKHSAQYRQYLTPGAYAARFGPTPATVHAVESALRASGLTVTGVDSDNLLVDFSGQAGQAESAFHTRLESYRLADGTIGQATASAVQLPSSIAGSVTAVVGLDQLVEAQSAGLSGVLHGGTGHPAAKTVSFTHYSGAPNPCSDATAAASAFGGLTDDQIANAYGANNLYGAHDLGVGQNIAVYELEPFALSDLATFDSCYAVAGTSRVSVIPVDGGQPAGSGSGEAILDVEDVSAFAPDANIDVYEAPNDTFGGFDEYAQIVNSDHDPIVTSSWGECEQAVQEGEPGVQQAENLIFEQAAAQGQSVFNSSGDTGSDTCNAFRTPSPVSPYLSVSDPASQPYVVAVGGTTIDDATQPPSERVWNDGAEWGAGGGGISESWPAPQWQYEVQPGGRTNPAVASDYSNAIGFEDANDPSFQGSNYAFCLSDSSGGQVNSESASGLCREVPDVSAQADEFTGAVTIYTGLFGPGALGWTTIGGTSSATPIWASLLALVNDSPTCAADSESSVGFVSPLLYTVAAYPGAYATSFNDLTASNNDPYGDSNLFPARPGYDMATGLGSPELTGPGGTAGLAANLCALAKTPTRPTVIDVNSGSPLPIGQSATVTVSGTGFESGSPPAPDVASVQVGSFALSITTVQSATALQIGIPASFASLLQPPGDPTDGAGAYAVTVTLRDGETSAATESSMLTFVDTSSGKPIPAVTSVHTYGGSSAGGNQVEIFGTGFHNATAVTFGGVSVATHNFIVDSDHQITVTDVPPESGSTSCVQNGSSYDSTLGVTQNQTNDICQVEVVVSNVDGSSAPSTILPLYEGIFFLDEQGVLTAPPGEEAAPQPTEYDYVPVPVITGTSTVAGEPATYDSEFGGSLLTITGRGFNLATFETINLGGSQAASFLVFISGTEIQLFDPGLFANPTIDQTSVPVSVSSLVGLSTSASDIYAGIPVVDSVTTSGPGAGSDLGGVAAAPDTGGTTLTITGQGFDDTVPGANGLPLQFFDIESPFTQGTQYNFSLDPAHPDTILHTTTVPLNPGLADLTVCTVTSCEGPSIVIIGATGPVPPPPPPPPTPQLILYPPGAPTVDSVSPSSGPATGGALVTITGQNLGCATAVFFDGSPSSQFVNTPALLDCGSTTSIQAVAPPGRIGSRVAVVVETVESDVTGNAPSSVATFNYVAVAPTWIADGPPAHAVVGIPYSYSFHARGDPSPTYSVAAGSLPPGLHLAAATGVLSGTPSAAGTYHFKVTASNGTAPAAVTPLVTITVDHVRDTGYWEATAAGGVYPFGAADPHGSLGGIHLNQPIVAMAATPDGGGYWLVATDGGVFPFGDAHLYGSLGGIHLNKPIVGIAASPTGKGYWLVASDGGIFQFGDANQFGSLGGVHLNKPIGGIAATSDGKGYWLVASDGGVFQFGDAKLHGSLGNVHLNEPIVAMAGTPDNGGYWLVAADGGIFPFGDAGFYDSGGSMGLGTSVVGMGATPDGQGYALFTATGNVIPFGDFTSFGSVVNQLSGSVIGGAIKG